MLTFRKSGKPLIPLRLRVFLRKAGLSTLQRRTETSEVPARLAALTFHRYYNRFCHSVVDCDDTFSLYFYNRIVFQYALSPVAMLDTMIADPEGSYAFHATIVGSASCWGARA